MWYARLLERRVTILMLCSAAVLCGALAVPHIPIELLPSRDPHQLTIFVTVRGGMPPKDVERLVTIQLEQAVSRVPHVTDILSRSEDGRATVQLSCAPEASMDTTVALVRQAVHRIVPTLPPEVDPPIVARFREGDIPLVTVTAQSRGATLTTEDMRTLVERHLQPSLTRVPGVARVVVVGGREEKMLVELTEHQLTAHTVPARRVAQLLGLEHINMQSGRIAEAGLDVRTRLTGEFTSRDELQQLGVQRAGMGSLVRLQDVGVVHRGYLEPRTMSRLDGQPVISCYVYKESEANTLEVAAAIASAAEDIDRRIPQLQLQLLNDRATVIREAMHALLYALSWGAFWVILVLYAYMAHLRRAAIMAAIIPFTIITSCAWFAAVGLTFNVMTLTGIALGIGMLLDAAIVVSECLSSDSGEHMAPVGVTDALRTVRGPLGIATLTTVIVFIPLAFAPVALRTQYVQLGLAIAITLMTSLGVSLIILPITALMYPTWYTNIREPRWLRPVRAWHLRALRQALRHPRQVLCGVLVLCVVVGTLGWMRGTDMTAPGEARTIIARVHMASGTQLSVTDAATRQLESLLRACPDVVHINVHVEGDQSTLYMTLATSSTAQATRLQREWRPRLRRALEAFGPDHFVYFPAGVSGSARTLTTNFYGPAYATLLELTGQLAEPMATQRQFSDTRIRFRPGRPEWIVRVDRVRAASFGVTPAEVAYELHARLRGLRATVFYADDRQLEVVTRLRTDDRQSLTQLLQWRMFTPQGAQVPLAQMVSVDASTGPSDIWRHNRQRFIQLTTTITSGRLPHAAAALHQMIERLDIPSGYSVQLDQRYHMQARQHHALALLCVVMLGLMWCVVASLYESHRAAGLVLLSIPLAFIGVIAVLWFFDQPWTLGALAGCVLLGGIVVNNAVILLAALQRQRQHVAQYTRHDVVRITQGRVRPILMTAATTVVGIIPLLLQQGASAGLWQPLALVVIAGVLVSTVGTCIIVPCAYYHVLPTAPPERIAYNK